MSAIDEKRLREVISRVPALSDCPYEQLKIEKVGGLTNRNYKVTIGEDSYVLRVPGEGTEQYVDRAVDEQAGRITSQLGVNADLVFYESGTGVQLTRFIDGAVMLTPALFKDLELCRRAGRGFATLHKSGHKFMTEFNDVAKAQEYLKVLRDMDARMPDGYDDLQKEAIVVREALASKAPDLVPSHNDPVPENFINTPGRMYILDWEFAGNNDPMWDLGDLSVEGQFDKEQDRAMLTAYNDGEFDSRLYSRMVLQKAMVFLLWTLWGALQVANKNPLKPSDIHYPFDDFWQYTMDRFSRCREIMTAPDFGRHMDAVRS